ncbi:MAG: mechanosensitive ion channel [Proteobacteria bacterium]|nr:mechanosensitive ion channel [Pseudomonadota bacterium]
MRFLVEEVTMSDLLCLCAGHFKSRLLKIRTLYQFSGIGGSVMLVFFSLTSALWPALPSALEANQTTPPATQQEVPFEIEASSIELKIKEIKSRLAEVEAAENDRTAQQLGVKLSQVQERTTKVRDLETVYQRLNTALKKKTALEKEEDLLRKRVPVQQQIEISREPPYSLSFYDTILAQLATAEHKAETANLAISLADKALLTTRRLLSHTQLQETTTAAFEKTTDYFTIFLIVLFALRVVNIPLTLFTFLGGAVAIGVGFGAQNLINNFISSFIIMAEQPIKIGDLIEIEGNFAMVEEIGARCTRIRTGANVHILVPNSSFLEKNIINWTLSDKEVRAHVTVGVIYGSPVREAERIMLQVANEHKRVRKNPAAFVLFNDFGDNALIFDLYFWISMSRIMDRRTIESDIRFRIDELFRAANIVIAFPQRDVHLDTQRPLEFRLVNADTRFEIKEKK